MPVIITGAKDVKAKIAGIRRRMKNPSPVWPRIGRIVNKAVSRQFTTRGAYFGTPWKPLTPKYLAWKLSHGGPRQILVMSGKMRGTLISRPMNIEEYMGHRAVFGTNNDKALWHHGGTRYRGQQINPPRPILKATQPLAHDMAVSVGKYIAGYRTAVIP